MRRRFASNIALAVLFALLTAHAGEALEPVDLFPQTTFSVALLVRPPPGNAFTNTLRYEDDSGNFHLDTRSYSYTPPYADLVNVSVGRVIPPQLPVTWNVTAAMGVQVNAGGWNNAACLLGDISKYSAFYGFSTCSDKLQGSEGPGLSFGAAGAPLLKSFEVSAANDAVGLGASLDISGSRARKTPVPAYRRHCATAYGSSAAFCRRWVGHWRKPEPAR
jgi:hypothetical protein